MPSDALRKGVDVTERLPLFDMWADRFPLWINCAESGFERGSVHTTSLDVQTRFRPGSERKVGMNFMPAFLRFGPGNRGVFASGATR